MTITHTEYPDDVTGGCNAAPCPWCDPHDEIRSELETEPIPVVRKATVRLDPVPNSEGWRSWVVTHPARGTRTFHDTWKEAVKAANTLAYVYGTED